MQQSNSQRVLLGVSGGIAAYKSAELIRLLTSKGVEVRVVMSAGAKNFITPLTLQTLAKHRVYESLWDETAESPMSHIDLARWADLIVIAPATAHFIAKLALGLADDLLTTLCLATQAPLVLAPAMNQQMWLQPSNQAHVQTLMARNVKILGPASGSQACGETGPGRLLEPLELTHAIHSLLQPKPLVGYKLLITAGPTQEAIDPVRFFSNPSSGKMGYAIAQAAVELGAEVCLISGPTHLMPPAGCSISNVVSAEEMLAAVLANIQNCAIFIATAAVSDYRPKYKELHKIKKQAQHMNLELVRNPDILATVSQLAIRPYLVGFAAETEDLVANAKQKLVAKKLDMIVANQVGMDKGFGCDANELIVIKADDSVTHFDFAPKTHLARQLLALIAQNVAQKK
jgi:phosphopantothenoylcysteine decarboxylase/phosphopantothenate--cysteine ligase